MTPRLTSAGVLLALFCTQFSAAALAQQAPAGKDAPQMKATPIVTKVAAPANALDVGSVDAIVAALYDTISGPIGKQRDWDRLRSLFSPDGRLVVMRANPSGPATSTTLSVDDYIGRVSVPFERDGFFEAEVAHHTESYGNIAQVFSTYASRRTSMDVKPFQRGINSVQLLNDGSRWWIVSLVWQAEGDKSPLPERYLKSQ